MLYCNPEITSLLSRALFLCDDCGNFAIIEKAMQSLPRNPNEADDIEFSTFVEKKYWKNLVREVISYYLEELVSE